MRRHSSVILTLTPNPSVDLLFSAERLVWDDANRLPPPRRRAGGQGINVARAVRALGGEALAVAPFGGAAGEELLALLAADGLPVDPVPIAGDTRVFVAAREADTGRSLLLNPTGPELSGPEADALEERVAGRFPGARWLAGCGSLPPGVPPDFYARLATRARAAGVRAVADCDGEPLRLALEAGCDLLVPNQHEAGRLLEATVDDVPSAARAASRLRERGVPMVAVTLGPDGAVLATDEGLWHAAAPPVRAGFAVGAGDAFLAALLLAEGRGVEAGEALRSAVAAGTAVLRGEGTALLDATEAAAVEREVTVQRL